MLNQGIDQPPQVEEVCIADSKFAPEVALFIETHGVAPSCFFRDMHSLCNCLIGGERSLLIPLVLHQVDHKHGLSMSEIVRLQAMVVFQEISADWSEAVSGQSGMPALGKAECARGLFLDKFTRSLRDLLFCPFECFLLRFLGSHAGKVAVRERCDKEVPIMRLIVNIFLLTKGSFKSSYFWWSTVTRVGDVNMTTLPWSP